MSTPTLDMSAFNAAVKSARTAAKNVNTAGWIIGDAAKSVQASYGQGKVQAFADAIGMVYKTVLDFRGVADAYDASERSDVNSHSIHQVFMREDDRATLVKSQKWTVKQARELVKSRKATLDNDASDNDSDGDNAATDTDPRAKLVANITRLEGELLKARAALVTYDADHATPAPAAKAPASKAPAAKAPASKAPASKATMAGATVKTPATVPAGNAPGSIARAAKAAAAAKAAGPVVDLTGTPAPRRSRTRTPANA